MLAHGFIGGLRPLDRLLPDAARDVAGVFQRGGEAFAGFPDFFPRHVCGGGHQRARIFGERAQVIAAGVIMFAHIFWVIVFVPANRFFWMRPVFHQPPP